MKEQLRLLQQLQDIDTQTKEIRKTIEQVPAQLAPAKQDLEKLAGMLAIERQQLADTETALGADRLVGEIARTTFQLRFFADALKSSQLGSREVDDAVAGPPPALPWLSPVRLPG